MFSDEIRSNLHFEHIWVNSGYFSQIMAAISGTVTVAWNPGHLKHCQATITKQTAPSVTLPHNPDALCGYTGGKMVI